MVSGGVAEWRSGGVAVWQSGRGSLARRVSHGQGVSRLPFCFSPHSLVFGFPNCTPAQRSFVCFVNITPTSLYLHHGLHLPSDQIKTLATRNRGAARGNLPVLAYYRPVHNAGENSRRVTKARSLVPITRASD